MLRSMIVAFSTYSKIPMPQFEWKEKDMTYSLCFFPLIGVIIGAISYGIARLGSYFGLSNTLITVLLVALPILITGGIHMDGFLDVMDAKNSYANQEKKLEILKDPHVGAFAIIYGIIYIMLTYGFVFEYLHQKGSMLLYAEIFVLSRILSGLGVVTFKKAKKDGMVSTFAKASDQKSKYIFIICFVLVSIYGIYVNLYGGIVLAIVSLVWFFIYKKRVYGLFGGVTGDTAGYFLQMSELLSVVSLVVLQLVLPK